MHTEASHSMNASAIPRQAVTAVDSHAHVMHKNGPLVAERHSAPSRDVDVGEYLGFLEDFGISHGVLTAPSFSGTDNSVLLESLARAPTRLRGTVNVEPGVETEVLEDWHQRGVVGIRLNWTRRSALPDAASPAYAQLFEQVRKLGWHVELFLEDAPLADVLPRILDSGVNVVLDHFGAPDAAAGIRGPGFQQVLHALATGRTWVKLSAPYRLGDIDPRRYVDALMAAGGPQRLLWASDFPWISHEGFDGGMHYRRCVDWLHEWVPDPAVRQIILTETPAHLFNFRDSPNVADPILIA